MASLELGESGRRCCCNATADENTNNGGLPPIGCYVERLFQSLLIRPELHISSRQKTKYRNKITYSFPISDDDGNGYSELASDRLNALCRAAQEWSHHSILLTCSTATVDVDHPVAITTPYLVFREIMVKATRSGHLLVRLTVQQQQSWLEEENIGVCHASAGGSGGATEDSPRKEMTLPTRRTRTTMTAFGQDMIHSFPEIQCLCYNIVSCGSGAPTTLDSQTTTTTTRMNPFTRPGKDSPLYFLTDSVHCVWETTPNGHDYQIGPDTFSEVNHEVELLQWQKTNHWLEEIVRICNTNNNGVTIKTPTATGAVVGGSDDGTGDEPDPCQKCPILSTPLRKRTMAVLIVSGRDVSSFGLGFGTLKCSTLRRQQTQQSPSNGGCCHATTGSLDNDNDDENNIFDRVIAIQHCPLVHKDAVQNFARHSDKVQSTVLHMPKAEMVQGFQRELACIEQQLRSDKTERMVVVGVMTGGRKGLDPNYISYLVHNPSVVGIVYNSCATKSLIRDMKGFLDGGFAVDDFRSYDFLPGTGYTASLTKLVRRRRTLILPVGPAGIGKSWLASELLSQCPGGSMHWWHRDDVFAEMRNKGIGLGKSKQLVHQSILECLRSLRNNKSNGLDDGAIISTSASFNISVVFVDSTNGSTDARKLYIQEAEPDLTILVVYQLFDSVHELNDEAVIDFLMERTKNRLGDNIAQHPSFPKSVLEQREKHSKILRGIEYTDRLLRRSNMKEDGYQYVWNDVETVVINVDPRKIKYTTAIPVAYRVFLQFATSKTLLQVLSREYDAIETK